VRALIKGRDYFPALAAVLGGARPGEVFGSPDGVRSRRAARRRGATDGRGAGRGSVPRSDSPRAACGVRTLRISAITTEPNLDLARAVTGGRRSGSASPLGALAGSHHQKFVVPTRLRDDGGPDGDLDADVPFVGENTPGDRQTRPFCAVDGPTLAWHDVRLRLSGPVVRDVETVFRQRWAAPAGLTRWRWHTISSRLSRLPQMSCPTSASGATAGVRGGLHLPAAAQLSAAAPWISVRAWGASAAWPGVDGT
jgi:hypothetical protein